MDLVYYNDNDPFCAAWLQNLIDMGDLPPGLVDSRSIIMANYRDLSPFAHCHFFAGAGGWPFALRLANWPTDEPVWTGSCPCQPFSVASTTKEKTADDRHLWPYFLQLIERNRPPTIFGEQISGADGEQWCQDAKHDLNELGYAFAFVRFPANFVGAWHSRPRFYWVADARSPRLARLEQRRDRLCRAAMETPAVSGDKSLRSWVFDNPSPTSIGHIDGLSRPVGIVRALGNAIVPQVAATFVRWFMQRPDDL